MLSAADFNAVDEWTSGDISVVNIEAISGTPTAIMTILSNYSIPAPVYIFTGAALSADIKQAIFSAEGPIEFLGSALTEINGEASEILEVLDDMDTTPTAYDSIVTGAATASNIADIRASTSGNLDGSGLTALTGTGAEIIQAIEDLNEDPTTATITAASASAAEANTIFDYTNSGITIVALVDSYTTGGSLDGMKDNDVLVIDESDSVAALNDAAELSAISVDAAGEWHFDINDSEFTWWDDSDAGTQNSIQLMGVSSVTVGGDLVTIGGALMEIDGPPDN